MKKFTARDQLEFVKTKSQKKTKKLGIIILVVLLLIILASLVSCTKPVAKVLIQKENSEVLIYGEFSNEWKIGDKVIVYRDWRGYWIYDECNLISKGQEHRSFSSIYACRWATIKEIYPPKASQLNQDGSAEKIERSKSFVVTAILLTIGAGCMLIVIMALKDLFKIKKKTISKH